MKDQHLIFIDLLQSELEKQVVPYTSTDLARNTSVLAAKLLRRLLVMETDMPQLRKSALTAYRQLLPALRAMADDNIYGALSQALAADCGDWALVDAALYKTVAALLATNNPAARRLVGQLAAIDARLRDGKEQAWIARSEDKAAAAKGKISNGPWEEQQHRLLDFIKSRFPRETELKIGGIKQIPGGFSKHTLFINLENNIELPDCLVMRRDGPFPGSTVTTEYPILEKLFAAGVAVPRPYAIDAQGAVYGKPFILVSQASGVNVGDFVFVNEPDRELGLDLAKKMAQLHKAPIDGLEDQLVGSRQSIRERLSEEIAQCESTWQSVVNQKAYVVQAAIDWLKVNMALAEGPRTILHRDIGAHNMLVDNHQVSAFLDWETAAVGTHAEDVAYTYYTAEQMVDWPLFLSTYEAEAGVVLDRAQLDFYTLWASVRIVVPISKGVDPVFSGRRKSLSDYYLGEHIVEVLIQRIAAKLADILSPPLMQTDKGHRPS